MYLAVLVTCPEDTAERITGEVLKLRLAACVNILGRVRSRYRWKGRLESADESLLLIKTRSELFEKLARAVKRIHPYETPEIIGLRVEGGNRPYLDWILRETRMGARKAAKR
ncbi:MAG: divalent-cation tolerance protein CutA [Nitrososphaerales archaeon]|nr:divalent-cation tolerance protein CutA [Nitrososphaerales archaeon]